MADAVVLINTESDKTAEAARKIVEIDGVTRVYSVAGDVDLVAPVHTAGFDRLAEVIPGKIAAVEGVATTQNLMAFRQYSAKDAAAFDLGMD
ncbi:Lrp/AsnC ligand binding domain-containing protein [Bifidobacterium sp. ESL0763]|uniref:Lrp/AsnC ligand binding domain-containing protein n=1 Tax=Bifidobacterium sp. ESL0763 TaxID=2983227 RepID=UPI0023F7C81B|nr:Lrp/AsnC ligand binding domain-containing protein [Bifidobacterium sp. ESL0763]MDF7664379.1 Lrp/AsnC ligand binding domain-containing protein [Bifidobacterium sp. ESL0763]